MGLRSSLATAAIGTARSFGNMLGCELAVNAGGQTLDAKMVPPKKTKDVAWDDSLFVKGNLFVGDYANPIKPTVNHNQGLDTPDTVDVEASEEGEEDAHVSVISSPRYRLYMIQDLVSQLLNPSERLTMIQWILVAIAGMQVMILVMAAAIASSTGVF